MNISSKPSPRVVRRARCSSASQGAVSDGGFVSLASGLSSDSGRCMGVPTVEVTLDVEPDASAATVAAHQPQPQRGMFVCFQDVTYTIPGKGAGSKVTILQDIHGFFEPGRMTAVLGHSGSGKTSLLNALAGRITSGTVSGTIEYGGLPPSRSLLRRVAGYVEQFDTLCENLTCREMLLYTAQLKRPRREPQADKVAAVEALLGKLGLCGCSGTQIGSSLKRGLSGGQAKRLNIGVALITDPRVLFLDEPTSGLDSFTAYEVMSVVAGLAREGTTVATTIHGPSAACFDLFDQLLVLMHGRLVYHGGSGQDAISYLTSCCGARQPRLGDNLAEWMVEAVTQADRAAGKHGLAAVFAGSYQAKINHHTCASYAQEAARRKSSALELKQLASEAEVSAASTAALCRFCSSSNGSSGSSQTCGSGGCGCECGAAEEPWDIKGVFGCRTYVTPAWWSLLVLLWYRTTRHYSSVAYVLPRVGEKVLFAAVVLSLYYGTGTDFSTLNVPVLSSLLFLSVLGPSCCAMIYLPGMAMERALFIRERNDGLYRPITYLLFKLLDEGLLMVPVTAVTSAAVFLACKLQGSFLLFWLVQLFTLANGTALAYFLAAATPSLMVAMPLLAFTLILKLVLCGFMIPAPAIPKYWSWAVKVNVVHYSWRSLMVNQYAGQSAHLGSVTVLGYFGFGEGDAWRCLHLVIVFYVGWCLLAWLALAYARTHKRIS